MTILQDRLDEVLRWDLKSGAHGSKDEGACVMEAVAYVAGESWSDHPTCASPIVAAFMRRWNDVVDDEARQELKPFIPRLVGTRGTDEQEARRGWMAADWLVHNYLPLWLRTAGLEDQAQAVESLPVVADQTTWLERCRSVVMDAYGAATSRRDERLSALRTALVAELTKLELPEEAAGAAGAAWAAWAAEAAEAAWAAEAAGAAGAAWAAEAAGAAEAAEAAEAAWAAWAAEAAEAAWAAEAAEAAEAAGAAWAAWAAWAASKKKGASYWTIRTAVREALKEKFLEVLRPKMEPHIESTRASARDLLERMLAVTEKAEVSA